jgi:hypothetical protein
MLTRLATISFSRRALYLRVRIKVFGNGVMKIIFILQRQ